jgi:hypothetical protein
MMPITLVSRCTVSVSPVLLDEFLSSFGHGGCDIFYLGCNGRSYRNLTELFGRRRVLHAPFLDPRLTDARIGLKPRKLSKASRSSVN